jgi:hypothetical protein
LGNGFIVAQHYVVRRWKHLKTLAKLSLENVGHKKHARLIHDMKEAETLIFTYLRGKGTTVQVGNKELGTFESKGFADAVFSIWLGSKPPSEDLKKGMLG